MGQKTRWARECDRNEIMYEEHIDIVAQESTEEPPPARYLSSAELQVVLGALAELRAMTLSQSRFAQLAQLIDKLYHP